MRFLAVLSLFVLLCAQFSAVRILAPVSTEVEQGHEIVIGNAGPGQTFAVVADPKVETGGKFGQGGAYDQMYATSLPFGWASTPSKLYGKTLQTDITIPKDAPNGEYSVTLALWDEAGASGLGSNLEYTAKVRVTSDVMDMRVEPASLSVGAGQPARYLITINNKGIANDVFEVGSAGVRDWEFKRSIYIPSGTSKTINYEVVGQDEEEYSVSIFAQSSSSDRISARVPVSLSVNTDLLSDYRATTRGLLLFPLPEAPVYFVAGLLSNLFQ